MSNQARYGPVRSRQSDLDKDIWADDPADVWEEAAWTYLLSKRPLPVITPELLMMTKEFVRDQAMHDLLKVMERKK